MKTTVQYTNSEDRQVKLTANQDKFLVEEQNITEGNFLIFSDTKTTDMQLEELQKNNLVLMDAMATTFEQILVLKAMVEGGTA